MDSVVDLDFLRQPGKITFDTSRLQFRECVAEALGLDHHEQLSKLNPASGCDQESILSHATDTYVPQGEKSVGGVKRGAWRGPSTQWIQKWKAAKHTSPRCRFEAFYHALLHQIIVPHVSDHQGIVFQREPTFRCHVSGGGESTGKPHIDAEYGHQPTELNFWMPMVRVWGSNSLFAESAPGRGDFAAFAVEYGEVVRFWGNQVRHYTAPNTSGASRVSLDFRVVPKSCFLAAGAYPHGTRRDGSARFQVGEFYLEMDANGRVWQDEDRKTPYVPPDAVGTHGNEE